MLTVGTKAPDFTLQDQDGKARSLSEFKGQKVILYFYSKDILLADPDKEAIMAYDVWKEKNMYGKATMGVVRTTYLIDENGMIAKAFTKVKAAENPRQMLDEL